MSDYLQPLTHNDCFMKDKLTFAEIIENDVLDRDVSYNVESLFRSTSVKEKNDCIIKEIYDNKVIEPMCKKIYVFLVVFLIN